MNPHQRQEAPFQLATSSLRTGGAILLMLALAACGGGSGGDDDTSLPGPPGAGPNVPGPTPHVPKPGGPEFQEVACKDYDFKEVMLKPKTITIHNNADTTIYPALSTSMNSVNEWVQGCFRDQSKTYAAEHVYKLYVNEGQGLPPHSSVTITLPLYSRLADGNYITWWNGGRVVLADKNDGLLEPTKIDTRLPAAPADVTCQGQGTQCALSTYSSKNQFPEHIYAQLSEYTFGDSIVSNGVRLLKPDNVGYNISYVDHVYLPVAIGPKNNPYIGYSGSIQQLEKFRAVLDAFLSSPVGAGWPVYNLEKIKLPGGYNIFAQRSGLLPKGDKVPVMPDGVVNPPLLTVQKCLTKDGCTQEEQKTLRFGESVQRMQNLWGSCVDGWSQEDLDRYVTDSSLICPASMKANLTAVRDFFAKNHKDYLALVNTGTCNADKPSQDRTVPLVPKFDFWNAMTHIYGWVPFNEGCGADANPLIGTKIAGWDHAKIQSMYIHELQYNHLPGLPTSAGSDPRLLFNPYVQLIHDQGKLDMNAYGFSVDDAVGFMSELGDGLIFAVGGSHGLENHEQFNYADGFSVNIGPARGEKDQENMAVIKSYGVCAFNRYANDPDCLKDKQDVVMPNGKILGFRVGSVASYPIKVRFTDLDDNVYSFKVNKPLSCEAGNPSPKCPANSAGVEIVDKASCKVEKPDGTLHPNADRWCVGATPNAQPDKQVTKYFINFPGPVDHAF